MVGYPLSTPPSSWWRVGPSWMVGWHSGWWVAWWVKGGCVTGIPVLCVVSPFCWHGGPVEWREGCGVVLSPCLDRVLPFILFSPLHIVLPLLHCTSSPLLFSSSPFHLCVRCHSIVGLVLCFCDRVVSLWNSGDGYAGWKTCGVYCLHIIRVVVCTSVVCVL